MIQEHTDSNSICAEFTKMNKNPTIVVVRGSREARPPI